MAEAKGGGPAKDELPAERIEQGRVGTCRRSWSAAGRRCGIPVQPWRQTTPREAAGRSVEAGGIQTGGRPLCLHEVHEDLEHLRGVGAVARPRIGDDGDDLHGAVTASATERALAGLRPAVA